MAITEQMFADARPINDEDYDSERQVTAENALYAALEAEGLLSEEYSRWCLKATVYERIDEAHKIWIGSRAVNATISHIARAALAGEPEITEEDIAETRFPRQGRTTP